MLKYHVIAGIVDWTTVKSVKTLQGDIIRVSYDASLNEIRLNGNSVLGSGEVIKACNGVVIEISAVLSPPCSVVENQALPNILEVALSTPSMARTYEYIKKAGLGIVNALGSAGPFTVFSPTPDAWLNSNLGVELQGQFSEGAFAQLIGYHAISGPTILSSEIAIFRPKYSRQRMETMSPLQILSEPLSWIFTPRSSRRSRTY